ncbi:EscU/YscU/HrcU family type III secretion system export apparatus switch protein [Inhella gelatinilytica]|uniref:Flagellar biosynthetic protein FlhB n=1 Tax=Inhella gelatinilytica TaxID=2795030 RepID=A0A931IXD7_9BURK|nr:flagellar type III secretion system protein FlhB [Inhella gelatinilytica]MBH9552765.1 EscU/YscU/HrcU family type III secretion system export apparatus switch protein [Inhella gelatinilytica]
MAEKDAHDHNLPASQRKIRKAREEGQLPRSRDLAHAMVLVALAGLAWAWLPGAAQQWRQWMAEGLHFNAQTLSHPAVMQQTLAETGVHLAQTIGFIGTVIGGAAVASQLALGGWNFTLKALGPRWNLLDPISGIGRLFSGQNAGTALKAVLLALLLGAVAVGVLNQRLERYIELMAVPLEQAIGQVGQVLLGGLMALVVALVAYAALDVPLQRQLYLRRLRMSRVEVKQEHKETEGSPEVKQRQRARMRELTRQRMMAAVPKADLVVMNPTHYAVALKYDETKDAAPRVVAKGADLLALRIRDVAKDHKVPVLQAPALARALFAHAKLDREVPMSLFSAVAQVLAWLYQVRNAQPGREPPAPNPTVPQGLDPHEADAQPHEDDEALT